VDEVIPLVLSEMTVQPQATSYATGNQTFEYVFDTVRRRTSALREFAKLANSEVGSIFIYKDATNGETLKFDARYTRQQRSSGATLNNTMVDLVTDYGGLFANRSRVTAFPREIDSAATTVLWELQREISLLPGETRDDLFGKYRDPAGGSTSVSGKDMVNPVSSTDYLMNDTSGGGGADLTSDLSVTATFGANGVSFSLTNNNATKTGYITKLQVRGKGIYFFDPVVSIVEDASSISSYGLQEYQLSQEYQDNPLQSRSVADYFLDRLSVLREDVKSVQFIPNSSASLMTAFLSLDVGDRFTLQETVSGISSDYFINGATLRITKKGIAFVSWIPELADTTVYWILNTSKLNTDTTLGW
jgi:hypothetical protein